MSHAHNDNGLQGGIGKDVLTHFPIGDCSHPSRIATLPSLTMQQRKWS
jgi:hypothetical protein